MKSYWLPLSLLGALIYGFPPASDAKLNPLNCCKRFSASINVRHRGDLIENSNVMGPSQKPCEISAIYKCALVRGSKVPEKITL